MRQFFVDDTFFPENSHAEIDMQHNILQMGLSNGI